MSAENHSKIVEGRHWKNRPGQYLVKLFSRKSIGSGFSTFAKSNMSLMHLLRVFMWLFFLVLIPEKTP